MVFTDSTWRYFSLIPYKVRAALAKGNSVVPFTYESEPFFRAYQALYHLWVKRQSRRNLARSFHINADRLKQWEERFLFYGALGLLPQLSYVRVEHHLERLVILIKSCRPHESATLALRLADALEIPGASLERIRQIQRCYGYGQRLDQKDVEYCQGLQHALRSYEIQMTKKTRAARNNGRREHFFDFGHDPFQQRIELFKTLSQCRKNRQVRPILKRFGVHPNRFYTLKDRYMLYGVWGLLDLVQTTKTGEKISPELELQIIEQRLMNPSLSAVKMIKNLDLKCSKPNVQKIYKRWNLSRFKKPISIRGVIPQPILKETPKKRPLLERSAKARFPNLIKTAGLKVNRSFNRLINGLTHRKISISNPGPIIIAPFLDQLGVVEALHTYGPEAFRSSEITNNIIVNVMRIIAGFPTIHDYTMNSDRSVAIGSGLSLNPSRSRFYDSFDDLRFEHLQRLRNDASCRAIELNIIEGKGIAVDYHCDPSDSRYPRDKALSKSPDKKGDMVYAHRPQILWDSITNTIINIAYCEGRSRAPSALYKFCEENLFKIIDPDVITEIYADSEYTGERQLIYLMIRSEADITMCLKQNPKIKKWKEKTLKNGHWEDYGEEYRIASLDFTLAETGKPFRFIVKQNKETDEKRMFS